MASQMILALALVAMAVNVASAYGPFGMGFDGGLAAAIPAAAANVDSARAAGHAVAAENRATDAMIDRAVGNPIGAAINENRALSHSVASTAAAQRSTVEAGMAGGLGGSLTAAAGANMAASQASRAAIGGPLAAAAGAAPYGLYPGAAYGTYPAAAAAAAAAAAGAYPGAYGSAYGYPYGFGGFAGPLGYGPGSIAYRGVGLRDYLMNDPALRMQREVSRTRVYW